MTDRELLELAAKAAGIVGKWHKQEHLYAAQNGWLLPNGQIWNPLTDDGDALRLAVGLKFYVSVRPHRTEVFHWRKLDPAVDILGFPLSEPIIKLLAKEDHDSDPYAATRRAIVRAAAEVGKGME